MERDPSRPLRVAAVFRENLTAPTGGVLPCDGDIITTCHACGREQSLYEASTSLENGDTVYRCRGCRQMLVVVTAFPPTGWTGLGTRLGQDFILNRPDLRLRIAYTAAPVVMSGAQNALDRKPG